MAHAIASGSGSEVLSPFKLAYTPVSAALAAAASALCLVLGLPVWAMFVGWISYFTRGSSLRDGAYNLACVVTGLGLGIVAAFAIRHLEYSLGLAALPVVVFFLVIAVHLMKFVTGVDNIPSYYLGIATFFAAHMDPSLDTYLDLTAAVSLGSFSAILAGAVQRRIGSGARL